MSNISRKRQWARRLRHFLLQASNPPQPFAWGIDMRLFAQQLVCADAARIKASNREEQASKVEMNNLLRRANLLTVDGKRIPHHLPRPSLRAIQRAKVASEATQHAANMKMLEAEVATQAEKTRIV